MSLLGQRWSKQDTGVGQYSGVGAAAEGDDVMNGSKKVGLERVLT